jgi:hypothetical protein
MQTLPSSPTDNSNGSISRFQRLPEEPDFEANVIKNLGDAKQKCEFGEPIPVMRSKVIANLDWSALQNCLFVNRSS